MKVWSWRDAIRTSKLEPTTKLVLYTISVYMNELGSGAFPSYATLASDCQLKKNTVMKHVKIAVENGFLRKEKCARENGSTTSNRYFALYPEGVHLHQLGGSPASTRPSSPASTPINTPEINTPENILEGDAAPKPKRNKFAIDKPDDIDQQVWDDYIAIRRQKKTPYTQTAHSRNVSQAQKAGISINEALAFTCHKGWQSFTADYYFNATRGNKNEYGTTKAEQSDRSILETLHQRAVRRGETS